MSSFPAYVAAEYEHGTEVLEFTPSAAAGETGLPGELMFYDTATQLLKRCGADPALIGGICEVDTEEAKGLTPNGKIPFRVIKPNALVAMCTATTPTEADIGVEVGIVRDANGHWAVDTSDTSNKRVVPVKIDVENEIFFVKFLAANLQFDAIAS